MQDAGPDHCSDGEDQENEAHLHETPIHNLPTELLVIIFSWLGVQDLSRNVARVCQRWRDALFCKTLWRDKEVAYETGGEWIFVFVLRVASSLKKISLTPIACEHPRKLVNALLCGPKDVKEFHYNLSLFPVETGARILKHFKDHVHKLHLVGYAEKQSGLQRNLSPVLGQMSQLESLKLSGYFDTKWDVNVLKQGCTTLQHLDVSEIQDECYSYLPLLDSVKDHLKTLKLPQFKSNSEVLTLVSCCAELNEITLCLDDLRCIATLHSLESLHIKWTDEATRGRLNQFVRDCHVFQFLKSLTLHYIPGHMALAIAKQCHQLQSLTIHGITSCAEVIKCVPSVERLSVVDRRNFRARHLQRLPRFLPRLKFLDVQGCSNYIVHPKIIKQIKKELPGLEVMSKTYVHSANKSFRTKNTTESSTDYDDSDSDDSVDNTVPG